jgi:hypothetical protein
MSAYVESKPLTAPSIKQHLAALRGLFNWLVVKQVVPDNPALSSGAEIHRTIGVTPIMEAKEQRELLGKIAYGLPVCRLRVDHGQLGSQGGEQRCSNSRKLAGATGLEPAASCVTGRRSNQLNYAPAYIAPLFPDRSLPFPPVPSCVRNCPRAP